MTIEQKISHLLIKSKKTLAIAESCTGGLLSNRLTNIPGSSVFLKFSLVAYSNDAKNRLLKVPTRTLKQFGAVSTQTALAMARGAQKCLLSDFGVAITGIAGPSGGTKTKPVGLTYIVVCTPDESICIECRFTGSRTDIKNQAATQALRLLHEFLV